MRIVFDPYTTRHGARVAFLKDFYAAQYPARGKGWFVHGKEGGNFYGGHYVRLVAWPAGKTKREHAQNARGHLVGWRTRREAEKAVRILTRAVRMGKFKP